MERWVCGRFRDRKWENEYRQKRFRIHHGMERCCSNKSNIVLLFQKLKVWIYAICQQPNHRHVCLSYWDSVNYFMPKTKAVKAKAHHIFVYHEILIEYREYGQRLLQPGGEIGIFRQQNREFCWRNEGKQMRGKARVLSIVWRNKSVNRN